MAEATSITTKRHDTWEPLTGRLYNSDNSPADLRDCTLRFLAKSADVVVGESETDGICVNVEDEDGPGDDEVISLLTGGTITVPSNRGRYRFEPTSAGVAIPGVYECEIEVTHANNKQITFPNKKENNPIWEIDEDIA